MQSRGPSLDSPGQCQRRKEVRTEHNLLYASSYVFTLCGIGAFEAFLVNSWYNFTLQLKHRIQTAGGRGGGEQVGEGLWSRFSFCVCDRAKCSPLQKEQNGESSQHHGPAMITWGGWWWEWEGDEATPPHPTPPHLRGAGNVHNYDLKEGWCAVMIVTAVRETESPDDLLTSPSPPCLKPATELQQHDRIFFPPHTDIESKMRTKKNTIKWKWKKRRRKENTEALENSDGGNYKGLEEDYMSEDSSSDQLFHSSSYFVLFVLFL